MMVDQSLQSERWADAMPRQLRGAFDVDPSALHTRTNAVNIEESISRQYIRKRTIDHDLAVYHKDQP